MESEDSGEDWGVIDSEIINRASGSCWGFG